MNPFSYCDCDKCKKVAENSKNEIWMHLPHNNDIVLTGKSVIVKNFFRPLIQSTDLNFASVKPVNVIWFSNGSWIFDSFCEGSHDNMPPHAANVAIIKSPKNILNISTIDELDAFAEKYAGARLSNKTLRRHKIIADIKKDHWIIHITDSKKFFDCTRQTFQNLGLDFDKILQLIKDNCIDKNILEFVDFLETAYPKIYEEYGKIPLTKSDIAMFDDAKDAIKYKIRNSVTTLYDLIKVEILESLPDETEKDFSLIRWNAVHNDGYYGVAFNFRKVYHIKIDWSFFNDKYSWYIGWDVESLCIFDTRAFDNTVELARVVF